MALKQTIRFCATGNGKRIAWSTVGKGPLLVRPAHFFNHLEFDFDSPVWQPWMRELAQAHTLLRYDAPGCGLSDRGVEDASFEQWIADLETVVDNAGADRFALFGCSQGAPLAVTYAARHPERVSALVLMGGYARGPLRRDPTPEQVKRFHTLVDLIEVGWGQDHEAFRQVFSSLFLPEGTPEQVAWFNDLQRITSTPRDAARMFASFGDIDVTQAAMQVQAPVLVLHAKGDARVPFEEGRRLASLIPGARFEPIDSRNHVLLGQEPAFAPTFAAIRQFLREHEVNGPSAAFPELTARERELVELLAQGRDNLQIAAHLGISEKTVRNKVSAVFDKLEVANRAQAIVRAREAGFGGGQDFQ